MSVWRQKSIWQLVNNDNSLVKGWVKIGDFWYYLDNTGTMYQSQWYQDQNGKWYYLDDSGHMLIGWQVIDQKNYCFAPDGTLYTNCTTPDGYLVDNNGVWVKQGLSEKGADFLESWEGYSSKWEDVGDGYWTIGIGTATSGSLGKQLYDSGITSCDREQACKWAEQESLSCYNALKSRLDSANITLNQNQIDALISLSYNIGVASLLNSTLFKNILAGVTDGATIRSNFMAWNKVNGQPWDGLTRRRSSEADLYLNSDYTGNV
jgi:lysozyme